MSGTLGTEIHMRSNKGVTVVQSVYAPNKPLPDHGHLQLSICCLLAGDFRTEGPAASQVWQPLSAGVDPNDEVQGLSVGPRGMSTLMIFFDNACLREHEMERSQWTSNIHDASASTQRAVLQLYHRSKEPGADFVDAALELLFDFDRSETAEAKSPAWLSRARDFVHAEFKSSISLARVASTVGIDPTHLARTFRSKYGCNLSEYIRVLRVVEASRLMLHEERPAGLAAIDVGFCDHAHFTRAYREMFNSCPMALKAGRPGLRA